MTIRSLGFGFILTAGILWGSENGHNLFQKGLAKERAEADPRAAIKIYDQVVRENASSHKLSAQALIRLAECHEKLGNAESRKFYEQVVRDYPDQKDSVTLAKARLGWGITATATGPSYRRVWDGPKAKDAGAVSYDERYAVYPDHDVNGLAARDLATGRDHQLLEKPADGNRGFVNEIAVSRDSKMIAYTWFDAAKQQFELRSVPLRTDAPGQPKRLIVEGFKWIAPFDWSPDGTRIAVAASRDGGEQIGLVSAADGSLQVLKSFDWGYPLKMSFSPDGKFLAYDREMDESRQRDVFILAVDGSREAALTFPSNDRLAGWSPDGSRLLFFSNRTGSPGLYAQAVLDGRPQGAPVLLKPDMGSTWSLGITQTGALYVGSLLEGPDIRVITFDFWKGQIVSGPVTPVTEFMGTNSMPEWSRDGKYLSYVSRRSTGPGQPLLVVRDSSTGATRAIKPELGYIYAKAWSPDGRSYVISASDLKGRDGLFLVDARTAQTTLLFRRPNSGLEWSPDGKKLYYRTVIDKQPAIVERDMGTGAEREIIRRGSLGAAIVSPDGRWIATRTEEPGCGCAMFVLFASGGGDVRELFRVGQPANLFHGFWTSGSDSIVLRKTLTADNKNVEFWQVPVTGGQPRKLDLKIEQSRMNPGRIVLHPDGRQLAYTGGERKGEVWVLQNFLPGVAK